MKLLYCLLLTTCSLLEAGPTCLFWTNCTTDVLPTGTGDIELYNYFSVFNRRGHGSSFAPDVGFSLGIFSWQEWSAEAGIDYLGGTNDPLFFNAKAGIVENKLFSHAPSFSIGIFNVGTRTRTSGRTNQDIVDIVFGKALPKCIGGTFYVSGFKGNRAMGKNRAGFMVGYTIPWHPAKDCHGTEYEKWAFTADYASGKNTIGGGGFALSHYFNPNICIETGPVWFNSAKINGKWKWSVQIYIHLPIFRP